MSGLVSVVLIVLLTGAFITRRDLASVVDRGSGPGERNDQVNPAWVPDTSVLDDNHVEESKERRPVVNVRHRPADYLGQAFAVAPKPAAVPLTYVVGSPNPPLDDVTNQRREKVKEVCWGIPGGSHMRNYGVVGDIKGKS